MSKKKENRKKIKETEEIQFDKSTKLLGRRIGERQKDKQIQEE